MMYKIIDIPSYFNDTDELSVKMIDLENFEKNAACLGHHIPEEITAFVKGLVPDSKSVYAHVIAVSADEYYGCFVKDTKILMDDLSEKNIQDVKKGNYVITHNLKSKQVTKFYKRKTNELIYDIKSLGINNISCTGNHPFWIIPKERFLCEKDKYKRCMPDTIRKNNICKRYKRRCVDKELDLSKIFVNAEDLRNGDFLTIPRNNNYQYNHISLEDARLIGYYASEGSLLKFKLKNGNISEYGIKLDICKDELKTLGKDIEDLCKKQNYKFACYDISKYRDDNSLSYLIYSKKLVKLCKKYIGVYSREKFISPYLLNQSNDIISNFLAGYIDGDGTIQNKNRIAISTASEELCNGVQKLFFKLGIPASIFKYKPTDNNTNHAEFHFRICTTYRVKEVVNSFKTKDLAISKQNKCWSFCDDEFIYLPIRKIKSNEFEGYVYNLEVEDDNTYIANNIIVHNSNRNGDAFPEKDLLGTQDEIEAAKNSAPYTGQQLQRYKTFLMAHFFKHHVNKDPEKSFGKVVCAAYNMPMHRVELIIQADREKDPDFASRLERNIPIPLSMGCKVPFDSCFVKNTKVLTSIGYKNIQNIKIGDNVYTDKGRFKKVIKTFKNKSDNLISIKIHGFWNNIIQTNNHPYKILDKNTIRCMKYDNHRDRICINERRIDKKTCKNCKYSINLNPKFVSIDSCRVGDYVLYPTKIGNKKPEIDPWLLGIYLAEGSLIRYAHGRSKNNGDKYNRGIQFSLNINEENIADRIIDILDKYKIKGNKYYIKERNSLSVVAHSRSISDKIDKLVGRGSHDKYISNNIFNWDKEFILQLIAGWVDGDGSFDNKKQTLRATTVSDKLCEGIYRLALNCEIPACVQNIIQSTSFDKEGCMSYVFYFSKKSSEILSKYMCKDINIKQQKISDRIFYDNIDKVRYAFIPINSISKFTGNENVYNFSVKDDETYVVGPASVHNCSICGKKAKNRAEYCVHTKTMMNRILDDGRQVKVYNTKPRFFDISKVLVPADEQAYTLSKVASAFNYNPSEGYDEEDNYEMEKLMAAFKSGEINKKIPGTTISDAVKNVNTKLMSMDEPDIEDKDLESISDHPLKDILSTVTNMGMVLKPAEHRKIIIIKISKNPDFLKESQVLDVDFQDPSIYNKLKKYATSRSCYTDYLVKRASVLSKTADYVQYDTDPISDSLYRIYRNELLNLDAEKLASNIDRNFNIEGLFKESAKIPFKAKHYLAAAGVPMAAAYMTGAHKQYKRMFEGKRLGDIEKSIANHPARYGAAGAIGGVGMLELLKRFKLNAIKR